MELQSIFSTLQLSPDITTIPNGLTPVEMARHLVALKDAAKTNYRQLAHIHHPDKKTGNADAFKRLNEAYEIVQGLQIAPRQQPVVAIHIRFDGSGVSTGTSTTTGWNF